MSKFVECDRCENRQGLMPNGELPEDWRNLDNRDLCSRCQSALAEFLRPLPRSMPVAEMMADHMLVCEKHPYPEAHRRAESAELRATEAEKERDMYRTQWKDTETLLRAVERQRDELKRKHEGRMFRLQDGPSAESRVAALQAQLETQGAKVEQLCGDVKAIQQDYADAHKRELGLRSQMENIEVYLRTVPKMTLDGFPQIRNALNLARAALSQLPTPAQAASMPVEK